MQKARNWTKGYLVFVLTVVFFANFLNYIDRMVLSGLQSEIEHRFDAGETAFGFLWAAFTIGYLVTSPFIGYLADHVKRTRLFALCVVVWSAATVGCGVVSTYWPLLIMRVLIGVGEAGCLVVGPSLLADFFSRKARGMALSVFFLGVPLGGALGYITAAWAGFPNAFYIAGIPGFFIGALLYFMAEPERGGSEEGADHGHGAVPKASLKSYLSLLKTRSLLFTILAQTFAVITLMPLLHFGVDFFQEIMTTRLMEGGITDSAQAADSAKKSVTVLLGLFVLIGGPVGNFLGGWLGDLMRKKDPGAYALLAGIGYLIGFPCTFFGMMLFPHVLSLVFLFIAFTALFACMPLVNTQIANVVSSSQRAMAFASAVFILHILGDTVAVPLFGGVTEARGDGGVMGFRLFPFSLLLSSACSVIAWRAARKDVAALGLTSPAEKDVPDEAGSDCGKDSDS